MSLIEQGGRFLIGGDLSVHRMGYGAVQLLDAGPDAVGPTALGVDPVGFLRRVADLGVDLIDTADIYGPGISEQQIASALHPYRDRLVIATKGGLTQPISGVLVPNGDRDHLRRAVDGSLKRLKLDRIDLWNLHHIDEAVPLEDIAGTLAELVREGKLRHVGLSKATVEQLERVRPILPIATVEGLYNVADRRADPVVDYCAANGIGFMAFFPLARGRFEGLRHCCRDVADERGVSVQRVALAWLLARSPALIPIPGTRQIEQLEDNVAACTLHLTAEEIALIDMRYAELPPLGEFKSTLIRPREKTAA